MNKELTQADRARLRRIAISRGLSPALSDSELLALESEAPLVNVRQQVDDAVRESLERVASQASAMAEQEARRAVADAAVQVASTLDQHADTLRDLVVARQADAEMAIASARLSAESAAATLSARLADIDAAINARVSSAFDAFKAHVDAVPGGAERVADISGLRPVDLLPAFEAFGVKVPDANGADTMVQIWNHPDSPSIDDSYIWNEDALRWALIAAGEANSPTPAIPANIWLAGDRGTGKTQFAQQFAARTGRALVRINFDRHLERLDFIGSKGLVNGETVWQDGTFLKAFKRPGTVILLDEFGFANPANVANLQALLEPCAQVTFDGISHRRAPGVIVFAADNSTGCGDDAGRFRGVQEQNVALLDRFAATVEFEFLPPDVEAALLESRTGCGATLARQIVGLVNECRRKTVTGDVIDAPSLRQAFALAVAIKHGVPRHKAWENVVVAKAPAESKSALQAAALAYFEE